jgi:hypothetical protein
MKTRLARFAPLAFALGCAAQALAGATLVRVDGKVEIGRGSPFVWRVARVGDAVAPGEAVRTAAGARAELRLGPERLARIYERSLLRIGPDAGEDVHAVDLDEGASLFDLVRRASGELFDVRTPEIIVSVKGTRFLVSAPSGPDSASVFRGEVELAGEGFDTLAVHPGFTGALGEVMPTPFPDPWDGWASSSVAPEIAIEESSRDDLRRAIEAARAERGPKPAARDEGADEGVVAKPESKDRGDVLQTGTGALPEVELDGKGDSEATLEGAKEPIDPVLDVLSKEVRDDPETSSGTPLLDTVLGQDAEDSPDDD